jgi:UPF0755 protein
MRPLRLVLRLAGALVLLAVVGGGLAWFALDRWMQTPGPLQAEVTVDLPRGTGLAGISGRLGEAGVVDRPWLLQVGARLHGRDRRLRAGEYAFRPGMTPDEVLAKLESGEIVLHPITVAEGLTVREVFAQLAASDVLAGDLPEVPPEGTLLPETYMVPRAEARGQIVQKMQSAMRAELEKAWREHGEGLPLESPEEVLTLASIIEKETAVPAEYPLVAAVFVNRLRKGMPLQTDPTVIYALTGGEGPLGRGLTRDDLQVEHPYNTYRQPGLPPGPIANPGRAAIRAAVQPADVDYIYFVADGSGGHAFASTLEEHNRNVARWRKLKANG